MTNATNTSGGAAIGGNVTSDEFVGRDKITIHNIIIVGRFLEFAQIEGLLPKLEHEQDFTSIVSAIEANLGARLNDDLADAVAWTGEILDGLITEHTEIGHSATAGIRRLATELVPTVVTKLIEVGYWEEYSQTYISATGLKSHILWLDATTMLLRKEKGNVASTGIRSFDSLGDRIDLAYEREKYGPSAKTLPIEQLTIRDLRIILAGIVLDLIRIKSDNTISVQFLQGLVNVVKPSK